MQIPYLYLFLIHWRGWVRNSKVRIQFFSKFYFFEKWVHMLCINITFLRNHGCNYTHCTLANTTLTLLSASFILLSFVILHSYFHTFSLLWLSFFDPPSFCHFSLIWLSTIASFFTILLLFQLSFVSITIFNNWHFLQFFHFINVYLPIFIFSFLNL